MLFDKKYVFDRTTLGDDAPLRWSDLEEALALFTDILNTYSAAYDGRLYKLGPLNAGDLDDLLEELHRVRRVADS